MKELTNDVLYAKIDGKQYEVKTLKFGDQIKLTSVISQVFSGMKLDLSGGQGDVNIDIDMVEILQKCPEIIPQVVSLGLGVDINTVNEFVNGDEVMEAFEKIIDINPINKILGKSTVLLKNISLS